MAWRAAQLMSLRAAWPRVSSGINAGSSGHLPFRLKSHCSISTLSKAGTIKLPDLPYSYNALEPHISAVALKLHHDEGHAEYVNRLNELITGTELERKTLEEIIKKSRGEIFNHAAQAWNHTFYWNSMTPKGGGQPTGLVKDKIERSFSSFSKFKELFTEAAATHFGSGWAWLVWCNQKKKLEVLETHDAGNPLTESKYPILTCDVWEHAYYLDTQNDRSTYIKAWWNVVNWDFANKNLDKAMRGIPIEEAMRGGQ